MLNLIPFRISPILSAPFLAPIYIYATRSQKNEILRAAAIGAVAGTAICSIALFIAAPPYLSQLKLTYPDSCLHRANLITKTIALNLIGSACEGFKWGFITAASNIFATTTRDNRHDVSSI